MTTDRFCFYVASACCVALLIICALQYKTVTNQTATIKELTAAVAEQNATIARQDQLILDTTASLEGMIDRHE